MVILSPVALRSQEAAPPAPSPQSATASSPAPPPATPQASTPAPVTFEIAGSARSGKTPLPGVTVTAANTLTGKKYLAASNSEGKFSPTEMPPGRNVVLIEFMVSATFHTGGV